MGSIPEVTRATIAPLPVGGTVKTVEFLIPLFLILSLICLGSCLINLLLRYPDQSNFGKAPFSIANSTLVS